MQLLHYSDICILGLSRNKYNVSVSRVSATVLAKLSLHFLDKYVIMYENVVFVMGNQEMMVEGNRSSCIQYVTGI
jgi:hypothetical protein